MDSFDDYLDSFNGGMMAMCRLSELENDLEPSASAEQKALAKRYKEKMEKAGLYRKDKIEGANGDFGRKMDLVREFCKEENLDPMTGEKPESQKDDKKTKKTNQKSPKSSSTGRMVRQTTKVEAAFEVKNFEQWLQKTKEGDHIDSETFMAKDTHYMLRVVPHTPMTFGGKMAIMVCNLCNNDTFLDHVILTVGDEKEHMYNMEKTTTGFKTHADCKALMKNGNLKFKVEVETYGDEESSEDEEDEADPTCGLASCSNKGTLKCSRCKAVHYCSKACGKTNWKQHKKDCKEVELHEDKADPTCGLASCSNKGTRKCLRCRAMLYCSNSCGKANWNHHKKTCKEAENNK